ncbi:hypothetical protein BS78_06G084900 [Paspalum vaginatum]|nr:hypothetical protein BS78_06G084900 [Paspalum vaginatum]
MPQLDLDHLFCVGARCSVACEADAGAVHGGDASARADDGHAPAESSSAQLRARDGVGVGVLAGLFGAALRRDGSTKGSSNPKAAAEAATRKGAPRAESRRSPAAAAAAASKTAVVIGVLPAGKVVAKERRGRARAWRRPAGGGAKVFASDAAAGPEPVSPKVSCFGAVLSERSAAAPPGQGKQQQQQEEGGSGCCASLAAALRGLCCRSNALEGHLGASESNSKAAAPELPQRVAVMSPPPPPVAGLGDLKRLASRRWPETMAAEAEARGSV